MFSQSVVLETLVFIAENIMNCKELVTASKSEPCVNLMLKECDKVTTLGTVCLTSFCLKSE